MANSKKKVLILFGGKSGEHEVSLVSARSVFKALDREQYDVTLVGIDKQGRWLLPNETLLLAQSSNPKLALLENSQNFVSLLPFESEGKLIPLGEKTNVKDLVFQSSFDVVLPILHGSNGEDGTIQGLLDLTGLPYVGSGVLGSSLCMDKDMAKKVLREAGVPVVPSLTFRRIDFEKNSQLLIQKAEMEFSYPYFIKPANMGSSVGVSKVKSRQDAEAKWKHAFDYDTKVLVEKAIDARELECAVLGNEEPKASVIGEIVPLAEFYSYEAKYVDENGALLKIPAPDLSSTQMSKLQDLALKAFLALECSGMARVDFFQDKKTGEFYVNELNTIPGFTPISMYPKLWEASGLSYSRLLDRLIDLAMERHQEKARNKTSYV